MKKQIKFPRVMHVLIFLAGLVCFRCEPVRSETPKETQTPASENHQKIMLAILLDTSNSMDGLIEQAKSQLWKIVNELANARCTDDTKPELNIALYEYGNDNLPSSEGYIRLVSPLTNDLDLISEKLFALKTNGGNEYCGYVIKSALTQLAWSSSIADLKIIFIAGNEPFTQGSVPYEAACSLAKEKDVVVNTIFCGDFNEGVQTYWKKGADITGGSYMSIEQNTKTVFIPSPYDDRIDALNEKLNDTYVYYGKQGMDKKESQLKQDENAESYSKSNKVERAVSKSTHAYKNSSWDLVDAVKENEKAIATVEEQYLPDTMKTMTLEKRKQYIAVKGEERERIKSEIQQLNTKRKQFLAAQPESKSESTLDAAMLKAIREKGRSKELKWN